MLFQSMASIIDQFMLSGLNFGIGLYLIRMTSKEEYGLYAQLFAAGLLACSILEAFLGTTLTTLASREPDDATRKQLIQQALRLQLRLSVVFGLLASVACYGVFWITDTDHLPDLDISLAFGLYVGVLTLREFFRTVMFLESRPVRVLKLDATFLVLAVTGGVLLDLMQATSLAAMLVVLALANLLSAGSEMFVRLKGSSEAGLGWRQLVLRLWPMSKWAVPGALLGWAGNYSYLYLATIHLSLAAAADLNASRLLLMPISLVGLAWSRIARPIAGSLIGQQQWTRLTRITVQSVMGMQAITWVYVVALALSFDWLGTHLLGPKYHNVDSLLLVWGAYFAVYAVRIIGTTWLGLYGRFNQLFWMGALGLSLQIALMEWLMPLHGVAGAIWTLVVVECLETAVVWTVLLPRARQREQRKTDGEAA